MENFNNFAGAGRHEQMTENFVRDCWEGLIEKGPEHLFNILKCVKLPPGNEDYGLKKAESMILYPDSPWYFFSQGGSALCFFHATPFDRWPVFEPIEATVGGAPYPVNQDDAASTFASFVCWMMSKADDQMEAGGFVRYPEPYRHWAYAYIGVRLWVYGWVNKEAFIKWAWERGLIASPLWTWDRWDRLDLEKSGVLSMNLE